MVQRYASEGPDVSTVDDDTVDNDTVDTFDEFGIFDVSKRFIDAGQRYWTTARRSAKAKKQLRHWKTKKWIKSRLNFDFPEFDGETRARTDTGVERVDDLDAIDIPAADQGFGPDYEINPGLVKKDDPHKETRRVVRGTTEDGSPVEEEVVRNVLDVHRKPYKRTKVIPSPRPVLSGEGLRVWINNGADWDTWDEATRAKVLQRFLDFREWDPGSAGSLDEMVANVVDAFDAASPLEARYGERWYDDAAEAAGKLATAYGVPPQFASAVIAATSPRTNWDFNVAAAKLVFESLMPDKSPDITNNFLNIRMRYDKDLSGKKLEKNKDTGEYENWPNGWDYILNDKNVRREFERVNQKEDNETVNDYNNRITGLIRSTLQQSNPDGTPLKLYQFRSRAIRNALMDINNRHLGNKEHPDARPGMGLLVPTRTADGFLNTNTLNAFPGILEGNTATIDRLFGYDQLHPKTTILPKEWDGTEDITDIESLLQRIETSLAGHKVRSFYNNIVTRGQSDFATIDVHALRAALSGKAATRAGLQVPGQEELLDDTDDKDPDQARIGAYGAVNEAFRRAAAIINERRKTQGLPPLSVAQVQATAWIASRPESIAGQMAAVAMDVRDTDTTLARLLPDVPLPKRETAWALIAKMRQYEPVRFLAAGIDPSTIDEPTFNEAKKIIKQTRNPFTNKLSPGFISIVDQYKAGTAQGTIGRTAGQMNTLAWLLHQAGDGPGTDEQIVEKVRKMFSRVQKDEKTGETVNIDAPFTLQDLMLAKQILGGRYMFPPDMTKSDLLNGPAGDRVAAALERVNRKRRANGVPADLTIEDFIQYIQEGDYV